MSQRLIDADEYKEKLYAMMPEFDEENDKKCIEGQTIFFCIAALNDMPTIAPPPNAPLTLDELREMDGMPVWISPVRDEGNIPERWMLMAGFVTEDRVYLFMPAGGMVQAYSERTYRKTWLAYRHKLEEGTT